MKNKKEEQQEVLEQIQESNLHLKKLSYIMIGFLILNFVTMLIINGSVKHQPIYDDDNNFDVSMFTTITLDQLEEHISNDEFKLLLIGKPSCEYTNQLLPTLKKAQEEYGYETLYVDLRKITEKQQEKLLTYDDDIQFLEEYLGTTPMIIVFKNNQMVDTWVGYESYEVFAKFLENLGLEKKNS